MSSSPASALPVSAASASDARGAGPAAPASPSRGLALAFWIPTALVALGMLFAAFKYLTDPALAAAFAHLGFPGYFRIELAIAKLLGALALLLPVPPRAKEWAYAGFSINFVSAAIAHLCSGDPAKAWSSPLVMLALLVVSLLAFRRRSGAARA